MFTSGIVGCSHLKLNSRGGKSAKCLDCHNEQYAKILSHENNLLYSIII